VGLRAGKSRVRLRKSRVRLDFFLTLGHRPGFLSRKVESDPTFPGSDPTL
jgi:hypothetical protein